MRVTRGRHSEKPAVFRDLIASWFPTVAKLEFARVATPGWDAWGNEVRHGSPSKRRKPMPLTNDELQNLETRRLSSATASRSIVSNETCSPRSPRTRRANCGRWPACSSTG